MAGYGVVFSPVSYNGRLENSTHGGVLGGPKEQLGFLDSQGVTLRCTHSCSDRCDGQLDLNLVSRRFDRYSALQQSLGWGFSLV